MSGTSDISLPLESQTARYRFLDLYRGLFVILMLEGHVVRELLSPVEKLTRLFSLHELLHGITAPGFFFGAGFAFAISSRRRWASVTSFSPGWFRRTGRALLLLAVGYALHMPFLSLAKTLSSATNAQWNEFLAFGVLQCVGITLCLLYLLIVLIRKERPFIIVLFAAVPLIVYATPVLTEWSLHGEIPLWLRSALNTETGSPYPLTPFAAFMLSGVVVSWGFLHASGRDQEHRFMLWLFLAGFVAILFALAAQRLPFLSSDESQYWGVSPNFFWLRLGLLFIVLSILWFIEERLPHAVFPVWITDLGVESFFIYIFHLVILYGWVINADSNLQSLLGGSLSFSLSLFVAVAFLPGMVLGAHMWRWLKKRHSVLHRGLLVGMGFIVLYAFFFHPY